MSYSRTGKRTAEQIAAINAALKNLPYELAKNSESSFPNAHFTLPKGKRAEIMLAHKDEEGNLSNIRPIGGTMLTYQFNGVKFPIGSRVFYASVKDAKRVRNFWETLIKNSNTWYNCPTFVISVR